MRPNINLVNLALLPPKPFFQFRSMALALAVLTCGLFLFAIFMFSTLGAYESTARQAQARLAEKQAQLAQRSQTMTVRQKDPDLASRLTILQAEQQDLQRIEQALQAGLVPVNGGGGASAYLYALAQQPLPGVWLTEIQVQGEGVSIQGMALRPEAIPATLALLNTLPAFQGKSFSAFEAGRVVLPAVEAGKPVDVLSFRLASSVQKEAAR